MPAVAQKHGHRATGTDEAGNNEANDGALESSLISMGTCTRMTFQSAVLILAASLVSGHAAGSGSSPPPGEYQVKAAFLYNFARFVEWPAGAFSSPKDPLTICIFGDDPFGPDLDDAVKGKTAGEREILVRRVKHGAAGGACQMAFASSAGKKRFHELLDSLSSSPVLTVADTAGFAQSGGVINLVLEGANVRFEINIDAAERAHLRISSALLGLAKIVRDGGSPR